MQTDGYVIRETDDPLPTELAQMDAALAAYNRASAGHEHWRRLDFFVRDLQGRVVGGLHGYTEWNWLHIAVFWLDPSLRQRGLGSELLRRAERAATERGCDGVWLSTFTFQAPGFYERHGYTVFGTLANYPPGSTNYFMQKRLIAGEQCPERPSGPLPPHGGKGELA